MTTSIKASEPCCPISIGEVCWDDGVNSGRAFAVYDPVAGTTSFINAADGTAVAVGDVVACPTDAYVEATGTIAHTVATANGTVVAGKQSVTITNVGTTAGTVLGASIAPGETISYSAYQDPVNLRHVRLPAIAYTASSTAILSISTMD